MIVAADDVEDLETFVKAIKGRANDERLDRPFEQRGDTLPGVLRGHEHSDSRTAYSQSACAGKSAGAGRFYHSTLPRWADPRARSLESPGSHFCGQGSSYWASGASRRSISHLRTVRNKFPRWAALGSDLVCRRLR